MKEEKAKQIASQILNSGVSRIKILPNAIEDVKKALTRNDIRKLIEDKKIIAIAKKQKMKKERKKKSVRKGTAKARRSVRWEDKVRAQRRLLKKLKEEKKISNQNFKKVYKLIKSGNFASKSSLLTFLKDQKLIEEEATKSEEVKQETREEARETKKEINEEKKEGERNEKSA
jgi:large subunit ribosomal protein L19e